MPLPIPKKFSKSKHRESLKFLQDLKQKTIQSIKDKKKEMKLVDKWQGKLDREGKITKVHIEIFKPKKTNYYIYIECDKHSFGRCVFGPLLSIEKGRQDTKYVKNKGKVTMKNPIYDICVNWSARGSHHGSPMYSYKERGFIFSKSETTIDNLIKFLSKYTKTVKDKTKKSVRKITIGGKHHHIRRSGKHSERSILRRSLRAERKNKKYGKRSSKSVKNLPKSKTYTYCEKRNEDTPNKTKVCKQLCHSMSKKGYIYTPSSWKTHCKDRQWYSPDKYRYTAKELKENKERYERSLP